MGSAGKLNTSSELPSSAEEGWLRGKEKVAKPPLPAQTGAERKRDSAQP